MFNHTDTEIITTLEKYGFTEIIPYFESRLKAVYDADKQFLGLNSRNELCYFEYYAYTGKIHEFRFMYNDNLVLNFWYSIPSGDCLRDSYE